MTALEIQWQYFDLRPEVRRVARARVGGEEVGAEVLRRWEAVLTALETDPMSLAEPARLGGQVRLLEAYRERHGLDWDDAQLAALDLQYHDLRPEQSLFARLGLER